MVFDLPLQYNGVLEYGWFSIRKKEKCSIDEFFRRMFYVDKVVKNSLFVNDSIATF